MSVYIFEAATGRLVTRLCRLGNVINCLAFSPDCSRLAATTGGEGMRLWEEAGGFSPKTRTMAASAALAQLSMMMPGMLCGR